MLSEDGAPARTKAAFGTRHAQEDPSEDEKSTTSAGEEIAEPMPGIDRWLLKTIKAVA
jgi:hypothetical protein